MNVFRELRFATGLSVARVGLRRDVAEVAKDDLTIREDVFLVALEVAAAEDGIDEKERATMNDIAKLLQVDGAKLMAA